MDANPMLGNVEFCSPRATRLDEYGRGSTQRRESGPPMANSERTPGDLYDRFDWLAGRSEEPFDASTPIIDAHHHLWDRPTSRYLAEELHTDLTTSHNVTHSVFVECGFGYDDGPPPLRPVGETRSVAAEAKRLSTLGTARLGAIVGHADMALGAAIAEVLDAHIEAGAGLFRGIRHGTNISDDPAAPSGHHQPTPGMMASSAFLNAARALGERSLSFDAWVYHHQLTEVAAFARAVPELTIVLNHLGGPLGVGRYADHPDDAWTVWRDGMAAVAACPNVVVKIGGIGMTLRFGTDWAIIERPPSSEQVAAHWQPWADTTIGLFGPSRVMCESNFPVDRQCLSYPVVWNSLQRLVARYGDEERSAMLHGTAAQTYRISL